MDDSWCKERMNSTDKEARWCSNCAWARSHNGLWRCANPHQTDFNGMTGDLCTVVRRFDCSGNWFRPLPTIGSRTKRLLRVIGEFLADAWGEMYPPIKHMMIKTPVGILVIIAIIAFLILFLVGRE